MKFVTRLLLPAAACLLFVFARAQERLPVILQQQLENETSVLTDDDTAPQQLDMYARRKLALNRADEPELQSLGLLTPLQITGFLTYRRLLGKLVSIYELQAVPGFTPEVIRRILPYVSAGNDLEPVYGLRDYVRSGEHQLLLRAGRQLERSRAFLMDSGASRYTGSADRLFLRYRYSFPRYASWGVTMEKDPGEQWFKGSQRHGFDFYSAHLQLKNMGGIKSLVLGDYTANLGQGLLQWQAAGAYGKSAAVMQVKREGEVLRPYTAAGEQYFFRGGGITMQWRRWELTSFISFRRLDATIDSAGGHPVATTIRSTGYHRTFSEQTGKGRLQQLSAGGTIRYVRDGRHIGVNMIWHRFTPPWQPAVKDYSLYAFRGQRLLSASIDFAGTWKQVHVFGEVARNLSAGNQVVAVSDTLLRLYKIRKDPLAVVAGLLTTITPYMDVVMVYRRYSPRYQALYPDAFGDGYRNSNESGIYTGITFRTGPRLQLNAYADIFRFPWMKYRVSKPSRGQEYLLQGIYSPVKSITAYIRYRYKYDEADQQLPNRPGKTTAGIAAHQLQLQYEINQNGRMEWGGRLACTRVVSTEATQQGWVCYQEAGYRFKHLPLTVRGRCTVFRTTGYDARFYVTENSMLYDHAVTMLYGKGWQYDVNVKWKITKKMTCWLKWQQTIYPGTTSYGSGRDAVDDNSKSIVRLQLQQLF